jgi:hypothetical protein
MSLHDFLDMIDFSRHKINFGIFMSSLWLLDPEVAMFAVPSMGTSAAAETVYLQILYLI